MYQPALRADQIRALYFLKLRAGRPMTRLLREACGRVRRMARPTKLISEGEAAEPDEARLPWNRM